MEGTAVVGSKRDGVNKVSISKAKPSAFWTFLGCWQHAIVAGADFLWKSCLIDFNFPGTGDPPIYADGCEVHDAQPIVTTAKCACAQFGWHGIGLLGAVGYSKVVGAFCHGCCEFKNTSRQVNGSCEEEYVPTEPVRNYKDAGNSTQTISSAKTTKIWKQSF